MPFCQKCGNEVSKEFNICPNCGNSLKGLHPSKDKKNVILAIGALVTVIGLIAFFYPENVTILDVVVSTRYPYREFSLPLGILGIIVLVIGLALPVKAKAKLF